MALALPLRYVEHDDQFLSRSEQQCNANGTGDVLIFVEKKMQKRNVEAALYGISSPDRGQMEV